MKTNYGDLPIAIGVDGHARMVGSGAARRDSAQLGVTGGSVGCVEEFDSKLEAQRSRHLHLLAMAGEVRRFKYHPFTVQIGPGKKYTPDFLIEYADRRIVIEEIKGNLKMKNARDSVTRLHVAAGLLPMFEWRLVVGSAMEERWIPGI